MRKNIDFGPVADLYDTYVQWEADFAFFHRLCACVKGDVLELMYGTGRLPKSVRRMCGRSTWAVPLS